MKVIYACNSDFGKPDNIGIRTFHAAKEAKRRGNLCKVITRGNFQDEIEVKVVGNRWFALMLSGIQQYIYKSFDAPTIKNKLFEKAAIKELDDCDVLHCYDYLPNLMKSAREKGIKVILDAHGGYVKEAVKILQPENEKYGFKQGDPSGDIEAAEIADYIICASEFNREVFLKYGFPKEKLKTIYFGVDTEYFKPCKNKPCKNWKMTDRPQFLFVGIVEPRKGVEYLINAFDGMKADLWIAGRKNKMMAGKLKELPNIKFLGQVSNIREYYNKADVFILPSLWESSAKATYEAMACGLPVIVTKNTGSFFKDRTAGHIVPIKDVEALKYSIQYFIDHPQHIIDMGKCARIMAEKYTWENYAKNVNDFYDQILV